MCSSDKQNMDIKLNNPMSVVFSSVLKLFQKENDRRTPNVNDIKNKRTKLKNLVEDARGVIDKGEYLDSTFIRNLFDAETYGDAIDYLFHNKLNEGRDLEQIESDLDDLILERSTNQSSGPKKENINIQPGNVRRCLLFLPLFPKDFVFNLKRVTRLSVPNEVIPEKLEQLPDFLDIIGKASNHFLLNANGRKEIRKFPEWDNLFGEPCLKGIKNKQNKDPYPFLIFKDGTNITDLPDFEQKKFMLLRYLSLRKVNLRNGQNLDLNKLSSLKYLDLKHTNVENCSWFKHLEKLQMLDLRYTNVKEISGDDLEKLGKLQHLLLGYIDHSKKNGKNQLVGPKLIKVKKLKNTNLKTLRAIEQPENIEEISHFSNIVDLSVTGLTEKSLPTFWGTLETFHNLTSLGVAVTHPAVIKLEHCRGELKKKLKRLRMEGSHSGLEKLGEFGKLNDLTLANMDIGEIPDLPELLCLRIYGVCQTETCKIELKRFPKLKKFVIGDMEKVQTVQIGSAVLETVVTLKFSNLPLLKEVTYTNKQALFSGEVNPNKTIFLRHVGDYCIQSNPGLKIYHYQEKMQCYKLNATENNQG